MTEDERITLAMLLGGEFRELDPPTNCRLKRWICYRPTVGATFYPNTKARDRAMYSKGEAATQFLGELGYWIDDNGVMRGCNP